MPRARSARPGSRPARAQQLPVAERRVVEELQVVQVPEAIGDHADGLEHVGARAQRRDERRVERQRVVAFGDGVGGAPGRAERRGSAH